MRHRSIAFRSAGIGLLFLAVVGVTVAFEGPVPTQAPGVSVPSDLNADPAVPPADPDMTPAACRREPECSVDSDCVAVCGPNGGNCIHARCPVRVCNCK